MFCGSSSRYCGLVCSVWLLYFLIILTLLVHMLFLAQFEYLLSRAMELQTMWNVRSTKPQISLRICAVWSEPLLVAWILYEYKATDRTSFGVFKLKRRLHRFVWIYSCQSVTLLEMSHVTALLLVGQICEKIVHFMIKAWNLVHGQNSNYQNFWGSVPSQKCTLTAAILNFKMATCFHGKPVKLDIIWQ